MTWRDDAYFLDMLLAARQMMKMIADVNQDVFNQSEIHQLATMRLIQIIGEAARKVSDEARNQHPQIEWTKIIGMRNRLVHDYNNVDLNIVWNVISEEIPKLIPLLEAIVPPEDDTPENN